MKVQGEQTRVQKVTVTGSEHTEAEGFIASVRINVDVRLDSESVVLDSEVKTAIKQLLAVGKKRQGEDGPNTYELKAKRLYKAMEHKFVAADQQTTVVTIGIVKFVKFRIVDGHLSMRYDLDARMPLAPLSQLVTYMDAECTLTTKDSQLDLLADAEAKSA